MVAEAGWQLRPAARSGLADIWRYGATTWGADQADRYADGLFAVFDLLAAFPEMARLRDAFDPPVRIHATRVHLVIYREAEAGVEIIRILHAARNLNDFISET
jgi:toxin ParE1/3/4